MIKKLPLVGRVQGAALESRGSPGQLVAVVQYTSQTGELCELEMSFGDAMYPLNILREMEKDSRVAPK